MKKYSFLGVVVSILCLTPLVSSAATLYSQSVTLAPGWNVVSTPRVLDSHSFSATETSTNFDVYVLDASQTSGWATMAQEGQTEFTPLFGYFINNKTASPQTLTFNYLASTTPSQRLFQRTLSSTGWYSIGVANPTYATPAIATTSSDTNNPSNILSALSGSYQTAVDFTSGNFASNQNSVAVADVWKSVSASDVNSLTDLRETKGYAVYITTANALLSGFQNNDTPATSTTIAAANTITNATSVVSQNVAVNVANQPLGGFQTNFTAEGVTVQSLRVNFTSSSTLAALTNVSLVNESGSVVAGPFDATSDTATSQHVLLTGPVSFPTGIHTYTIEGKIPSSATNNTTIQASTSPATEWTGISGNTTGNTVTISVGAFAMNAMTIKTGSLSVSNSASPNSQTIVAGGSNISFANIQLDASQSGENVRLSSLPITLTTTGTVSALSSCQLWNGTTALNTGSRVINGTNLASSTSEKITFSLDNSLTVPKGTIVTLSLTCNLSSAASGGSAYSFSADATTSDYSITGAVSGNSVSPTITSASAPIMTVAGPTVITVSTDSSSPSYTIVSGGTTGVTANVIKFRASNEATNLSKVGLILTSGSPSDLTQAYLYAGNNIMTTSGTAVAPGTLLGTATFTGNNISATSTLSTQVQIPKDTDSTIIVKVDIADIGTNQPGTEGDLLKIDYLNSQGTGNNSGSTIYGSTLSNNGVSGLRMFNTVPNVAIDSTLPSTGVADGRLMEFKVTADAHGQVGINQFSFTISTANTTITNAQLFAYADSGYSQAVSGTFGASTGQFGSDVASVSSGSPFTITAGTNPIEIPAGTTYYFQLKATVAGVTTGSAAVTVLNGDSAFDGMKAAASVSGNLVWSPNATATATVSQTDWTNAYGVLGLPASGLIQSRSN